MNAFLRFAFLCDLCDLLLKRILYCEFI